MPEEKAALDEGKNCPSCKKVMKKAKKYYRNGAYYCNKNCYKKYQEQAAAKAEKSAPKEEQATAKAEAK